VIVRAKDEAPTIERTLNALRAQSVEPEIVVVDSGSRDGTREIAASLADAVIDIEPGRFTYGRALNVGAAAAGAPFHFALSAHCVPPNGDWIGDALAHYNDPTVAAVTGDSALPGAPLLAPFRQGAAHARAHPFWGFSNHGSSWRADVWRRFPFDEQLDYAEDKEWALRVLDAGLAIVFDPRLWVDISHVWRHGPRRFYERERRAARALAAIHDLAPQPLRGLIADWWAAQAGRPRWRARLNVTRAAGLAGRHAGLRAGPRQGRVAAAGGASRK
jgi:rhamnosyltransferase